MQNWRRRLRGALGMGATWSFVWSAFGTIPRWVLGYQPDAPFPLIFGVLGFAVGVSCSGLVMLAERRRSIEQLSIARFAGWGGAGGALLSAIFVGVTALGWGALLPLAPALAAAGAVCAGGSLAIARRAVQPTPNVKA